ncbi:MAG: DUF4838 domain-containing protein [Lentisphaerae bacterium]|nr:DUF4838 domain-containing protein [Lentisphaerota bacterium]
MFDLRKKSYSVLLAGVFCIAAGAVNAAEVSCLPEPKIPRSARIDNAKKLTLVKDGKVNFELVVPDDALKPAKYAAKEAAAFLSKAIGQKITIKNAASGKVPAIIIGDTKLAAGHGIDPGKFDRDGFVIKTVGNNILIIGKDTDVDPLVCITAFGDKGQVATVFGVHDFLERFAGIRYYFPTELGTVVPGLKNWSVPAIDIYDRPDCQQRRFVDEQNNGEFPTYYGADKKTWRNYFRKQHYLWNRRETLQMPHCHGLGQVVIRQRFLKSHPEYFAMNAVGTRDVSGRETQLCYSSGIKDEIVADAKAFLTGRPASERNIVDWKGKSGWQFHIFPKSLPCYDIMPDDCLHWCLCEKCKKYDTPDKQSEFMWGVFAEIANKLKAQNVPGYITTMAYAQYRRVPDVQLPDNLLVMLAMRGPWNELTPDVRDAEIELLKAWNKKMGRKLYLWVYPGKYPNVAHQGGWPDISHTTPRAITSFLKRTRDYISGAYCENDSDRGIYNYLTNYVAGKVMWNLDTDIDQLLAEHAKLMFGPAAKPMQEFYESLERNWMKIAANAKMGPAGPETFYPSELVLWNNIYTADEVKRISNLFAVSKKLAAKSQLHLKRIKMIEKEMWLPTVRAGEKFRKTQDMAANWQAEMKNAATNIVIDGKLDDAAWKNAGKIILSPLKDEDPSEVTTVVRTLQDKDNFYFAFECEEPLTPKSVQNARDGKGMYLNSTIEMFLIPDRDPKHYYQWMFTPGGGMSDYYRPNGKLSKNGEDDKKWNSHIEFKTIHTPNKNWVVECRIPKSDMPGISAEGMLADFCRHRAVENATFKTAFYSWSPNVRHFGDSTRFGTLRFKPDTRENLIGSNYNFNLPQAKDKRFCGKWGSSNNKLGILLDKKHFVSGGASLRLEGDGRMDVTRVVKLKPNTEYSLSFYIRMDNVRALGKGRPTLSAYIYDGSGNHLVLNRGLHGTSEWNRVECKFKTDVNAGKKSPVQRAGFIWRNARGTAWIDHVELYEVVR